MKQEMISIAFAIIGWLIPEFCQLLGGNDKIRIPAAINCMSAAAFGILGYFLFGA
jgi:hypothetical protein